MSEVPAGIDPEPVTAWMAANVDGVAPPLRFERVAGGHSCLTYVVEDRTGARYVLRRPPIGHVLATAHDVAREHKIISALADSDVPVAPALGLCTDVTVNEAPFYIMGFVDGVVLHNAKAARELPVEARRHAGEHLVEDRKSTRLNSSHVEISYAVFCLKKKKKKKKLQSKTANKNNTSKS